MELSLSEERQWFQRRVSGFSGRSAEVEIQVSWAVVLFVLVVLAAVLVFIIRWKKRRGD